MYKFQFDISSNRRDIKYQNIGRTHRQIDRHTYIQTDRQTDIVKTMPRNPLRGRGNYMCRNSGSDLRGAMGLVTILCNTEVLMPNRVCRIHTGNDPTYSILGYSLYYPLHRMFRFAVPEGSTLFRPCSNIIIVSKPLFGPLKHFKKIIIIRFYLGLYGALDITGNQYIPIRRSTKSWGVMGYSWISPW